jgi:hypothetical protein
MHGKTSWCCNTIQYISTHDGLPLVLLYRNMLVSASTVNYNREMWLCFFSSSQQLIKTLIVWRVTLHLKARSDAKGKVASAVHS